MYFEEWREKKEEHRRDSIEGGEVARLEIDTACGENAFVYFQSSTSICEKN